MTISTLIGLVIFIFTGGLCSGISVGICLQIDKTKKALEGECKNCKFFPQCRSEMRMPKTGKCLVHQDVEKEKQADKKELENLKLEKIELRLKTLEKFQKNQEEFTEILSDTVLDNIEDIDTLFTITEDNDNAIQNIQKEIYDGKPKRKNASKKNTCVLCPGNTKANVCVSKPGKSSKKSNCIQRTSRG